MMLYLGLTRRVSPAKPAPGLARCQRSASEFYRSGFGVPRA